MSSTNFSTPIKFFKYTAICGLLFFVFTAYIKAFPTPAVGRDDDIDSEIQEMNQELQTRREEIEELKKQAEEYRQKLISKRNEAFSLQNQINILDAQIAKAKIDIKTKEQEIELTKLDIKEIQNQIERLKTDIARQKEYLSQILRVIYQNDEMSYLEILLMNDSLSEFFNQAAYVENLHTGLHKKLIELKGAKEDLDSELLSLEEKKEKLEERKQSLEEIHLRLSEQEQVKDELLTQTKNSEKKFQSLLSELKQEQEDINGEIVSLEKSIRQKFADQEKEKALQLLTGEKISWPVPKNTITSYFHDPDYPYRYIFEHPAIDIRARQGTAVSAAASGYVAKAKEDSGCKGGYSYIMIIHADGLATVYGHLSDIAVAEGSFVIKGQSIGASGGMPGTCGAGRLTTGPHLHFEVRLNGMPADPLEYL